MKKISLTQAVICVIVLITAVVACFYLTTRTAVSEGTLRIEHGSQVLELSLDQLEWTSVQGTIRNGKGEESAIDAQGILLADVLKAANVGEFSTVTITADDEYSAKVTPEEIADPGKVYLIREEDGGIQLIVFGDENSKRNVSNVVRLTVQ